MSQDFTLIKKTIEEGKADCEEYDQPGERTTP